MTKDPTPVSARTGPRWRFTTAVVLTVLFGLFLVAANHAAWLVTTARDTDAFVDALAPLPADSDVAQALGQGVADAIVESAEVEQSITDALPDGLQFIAVGVTQSLRDLITGIATKIVQSDTFATIWETALRAVHKTATLFARGLNSDLIASDGDTVILDLTSVYEPIAEQLSARGFDALENASPNLTIELFQIEGQGVVQSIVRIINSIRWFAIGLTIALAVGVFAAAVDRRRATVWVGSAMIIAMFVSLIDIRILKSVTTSGITDPIQFAGSSAALDIMFSRFVIQSWIMLVFGAIIAVGAWLVGDSARATSMRSSITGRGDVETGDPSKFAVFVAHNKRILEWGAAILLGVLLLVAPLPSIGLAVLAVGALIAVIAAIEFISSHTPLEESSVDADAHKPV